MPQFERWLACKSWLHSFITRSYTFFFIVCRCRCCCVVTWLFVNDPLFFFKWEYKKAQKTFIRRSNMQSLKSLDRHRHFYVHKFSETCMYTHTHTKRLCSVYLLLAHSNFRLLLACLFVPFFLPSFYFYFHFSSLLFPRRSFLCNLLILWAFILAFCVAIALRTLEFFPSFHAHVHILCL